MMDQSPLKSRPHPSLSPFLPYQHKELWAKPFKAHIKKNYWEKQLKLFRSDSWRCNDLR